LRHRRQALRHSAAGGSVSILAVSVSMPVGGVSMRAGGVSNQTGCVSMQIGSVSNLAGSVSNQSGSVSMQTGSVSNLAGSVSMSAGSVSNGPFGVSKLLVGALQEGPDPARLSFRHGRSALTRGGRRGGDSGPRSGRIPRDWIGPADCPDRERSGAASQPTSSARIHAPSTGMLSRFSSVTSSRRRSQRRVSTGRQISPFPLR
jgi:hypothetical protein